MRRSLAATLACVALVAAGCGGGDDDGPDTPKPAETVEQFRARVTTTIAAIDAGQCDTVERFNEKSGLPLQCEAKKLFKGFQVTGAKAYGTGGVVEFKADQVKQGVGAYTFAIGDDRKYQLTGPIAPVLQESSLNREPKDAEGMDRTAEEMVDAIRANDCNKFAEAVYVPADMPKDQACRQELTQAYGPLRQELVRHKDAKPERLEGNDHFMFYALQTGKQYRTLIVSRTGPGAQRPFIGFITFRGPATGS